ncbi:MAG TPA: hypothetical protein P5551_07965 [Syntrophales bacterium]|jgi:hypothetical protein|nr:hypothetical protein [Syntrophales bacterium]HRT62275.1 hypothetical protein [Syntrophales bacterium]
MQAGRTLTFAAALVLAVLLIAAPLMAADRTVRFYVPGCNT